MKNPSVCPYCGAGMLATAYRCNVCGWRQEPASGHFVGPVIFLVAAAGGLMYTVRLAYGIYTSPRGDELGYGAMAVFQSIILAVTVAWLVLAIAARSRGSTAAKLTGIRLGVGFCLAAGALVLALARIEAADVSTVLLTLGGLGLLVSNWRTLRQR